MKKLILFLFLFTSFSFSQRQLTDAEFRTAFDKIKKMEVQEQTIKDISIRFCDRIVNECKDTILVNEAKKHLLVIKDVKVRELNLKIKTVDISKLPAETLKKYSIQEDKFNSVTFLTHKKKIDQLYLYIGVKYNSPFLRFVCKYSGKNWVFFNKIVFLIDGIRYEYEPTSSVKREAYLGGVYEKSDDLILDIEKNELIEAIANCKETLEIRFSGENISDTKIKINSAFLETYNLYNSFDEK